MGRANAVSIRRELTLDWIVLFLAGLVLVLFIVIVVSLNAESNTHRTRF